MKPTIKNVRASDRKDFTGLPKSEFVIRKRLPTRAQVYRLFLALVIIVLGTAIIVYNDTLLGAVICTLLGVIMLYFGRQIEKLQGIIHATEFMNAIFSSALSKKYKFCAVVRKDGEIVYINRPFQERFPEFTEQPTRTLEQLFALHGVSTQDAEKVTALVTNTHEGMAAVAAQAGNPRTQQSMIFMVEPVDRPRGFSLLRGQ